MNVFPSEIAGTVDVRKATALMVEYAQTLAVGWVKARVELVNEGLARLAEDGKPVRDAGLKEILLNLLIFANTGDNEKVAEIFNEALRGDPIDVETFRLRLVNWLVDKVVDGWPPLPEELKPPMEASVDGPMPEELADLRPAAFPTMPREEHECLITLQQAAALVHRSKRALEEYKARGMPKPRVRGGGGKPSLWAYAEIRPWLTKTFDISLPERFFADRN